jgi:DHA1 family bicyclomycin/chloramphenicol resistance-like MFS transporter
MTTARNASSAATARSSSAFTPPRFGRRPVLLAGLAAFLVGTTLCGAAWSLPALIAGRLLQALGACAGIVLSRAMIPDVYEREAAARGLALVMMTMTLGPAISPAIGAYLAEWLGYLPPVRSGLPAGASRIRTRGPILIASSVRAP